MCILSFQQAVLFLILLMETRFFGCKWPYSDISSCLVIFPIPVGRSVRGPVRSLLERGQGSKLLLPFFQSSVPWCLNYWSPTLVCSSHTWKERYYTLEHVHPANIELSIYSYWIGKVVSWLGSNAAWLYWEIPIPHKALLFVPFKTFCVEVYVVCQSGQSWAVMFINSIYCHQGTVIIPGCDWHVQKCQHTKNYVQKRAQESGFFLFILHFFWQGLHSIQ